MAFQHKSPIMNAYICQSMCSFVNWCGSLGCVSLLFFFFFIEIWIERCSTVVAFICAGIATVTHTSHGDPKHTPCYSAQESGRQEKWISKSSAKRKFRVFTRRCWKSWTKGSRCVESVLQEYLIQYCFFFNLLNFVSLVSVNVLKTICPDFTTIDSFTCHVVMSIDIYQNLNLLCILIEF